MKFKIGDKVDTNEQGTGTIRSLTDGQLIELDEPIGWENCPCHKDITSASDATFWHGNLKKMELIPGVKPILKIGDMVRILDTFPFDEYHGLTGIVRCVCDGDVGVETESLRGHNLNSCSTHSITSNRGRWIDTQYLELIADTTEVAKHSFSVGDKIRICDGGKSHGHTTTIDDIQEDADGEIYLWGMWSDAHGQLDDRRMKAEATRCEIFTDQIATKQL